MMWKIPWIHGGCRVIFQVHHISSSFQYERFQTMITKFLGGPAAADSGTNYDGIICILGRGFIINLKGISRHGKRLIPQVKGKNILEKLNEYFLLLY